MQPIDTLQQHFNSSTAYPASAMGWGIWYLEMWEEEGEEKRRSGEGEGEGVCDSYLLSVIPPRRCDSIESIHTVITWELGRGIEGHWPHPLIWVPNLYYLPQMIPHKRCRVVLGVASHRELPNGVLVWSFSVAISQMRGREVFVNEHVNSCVWIEADGTSYISWTNLQATPFSEREDQNLAAWRDWRFMLREDSSPRTRHPCSPLWADLDSRAVRALRVEKVGVSVLAIDLF
jgi:hypothetical protein